MTTEHREALLSSEELLVEKLSVKRELLDKLSLCPRRRQTIERAATPQQQVKTLLDVVSRQPDSAFTQLLKALRATEQQDVATIISGDSSENAKKWCPAAVFQKMNAESTGNTTEVAFIYQFIERGCYRMLLSIDGADRRTDRFIDPATHSMR